MNHSVRFVPACCLFFFLLAFYAAETASAQGFGLRIGPMFNNDIDFASGLGFSLQADVIWTVDDDGFLYMSLQYAPFGLDEKGTIATVLGPGAPEQVTVEGSGPTLWSIMNNARFRLHDELDEPSVLISGGIGATLVSMPEFTVVNGSSRQSFDPDLAYAFSGMIGAGLDYPIVGENLALIAELNMPVNFFGSAEDKGVHIPGVVFSVGAEYRVEL